MCPLKPAGAVAVGADVGGSKLAVGLVDTEGRVLHHRVVPTRASRGRRALLEELAGLVSDLRDEASERRLDVRGIGIASAGLVQQSGGILLAATEALPGFAGLPLKDELEELLSADVTVLNDVHAMALGEVLFGAARDAYETFYISVGTGIGGALTLGGNLSCGSHGFAGDVGHVVVEISPSARRCPCGRVGHLEAYASGPALAAAYEQRAGAPSLGGDLRPVAERALSGDTVAREVLRDGARLLGRAVGGIANLLDPDLVVFGGGLHALSEGLFWGTVMQYLRKEVRGPSAPRVELARLGAKGAIVGAAASALKVNLGSDEGSLPWMGGRSHTERERK